MKKKMLQLQARKTRIKSYLQPFKTFHHRGSTVAPSWFYDPSSYLSSDHPFTLYEESQISYIPFDQNYGSLGGSHSKTEEQDHPLNPSDGQTLGRVGRSAEAVASDFPRHVLRLHHDHLLHQSHR
ncbi:hypothetical protein ACFX15_012213 [Malus domestica]